MASSGGGDSQEAKRGSPGMGASNGGRRLDIGSLPGSKTRSLGDLSSTPKVKSSNSPISPPPSYGARMGGGRNPASASFSLTSDGLFSSVFQAAVASPPQSPSHGDRELFPSQFSHPPFQSPSTTSAGSSGLSS